MLHDLIRTRPLGTLVALTPGGLDANHIPFETDAAPARWGTPRGHAARAGPVWREFDLDTSRAQSMIGRFLIDVRVGARAAGERCAI